MDRETACNRATAWISLRLDGELSGMENALLESHLTRCGPCRAAADAVEATTAAIRSAPVERPAGTLAIPRMRSRGSLRTFYAAAAATLSFVAVLTGLGSFGAAQVVGHAGSTPKLHRVSAVAGNMSDDLQLLAGVRTAHTERPIPGRIVWPA